MAGFLLSGPYKQRIMHDLISIPRKSKFQSFFKTSDDMELQGVYRWHQSLSSSFFAVMNDFEVVLRNTIHFTLSNYYDSCENDSFDWMGISVIQAKKAPLHIKHRLTGKRLNDKRFGFKYSGSLGKIEDAISQLSREGKSLTPDAVIAELSFAFWPQVIKQLKPSFHDDKRSGLLKAMFPNAPTHDNDFIDLLTSILEQVRLFRNRLGHHDSLLNFPEISNLGGVGFFPKKPRHTLTSLEKMLKLIRIVLEWIDKDIIFYFENSDPWVRLEQLICKDMLGFYRYYHGKSNCFINGIEYAHKVKKSRLLAIKRKSRKPRYPKEYKVIKSYYL